MSNIGKKIQANQDKQILKDVWGKQPKHRCPNCHRFTLWRPKMDHKGKIIEPMTKVCHWCGK